MAEASQAFDLFVIGGGINGAGIARDAAGRGLSVMLCEKDDLAEGTSSRSGKLVHGGLRYLEYYEFRLVRQALIEREVLLLAAPHIIRPMRFVLPHNPADRPAWLVRLGLFLYDHLGGRERLPGTRVLDLHRAPEGEPVKAEYRKAFEYSDCWVDDARLVVLNALDAHERGAVIRTRTPCLSARREDGLWSLTLADGPTGARSTIRARALVNAAGPWVNDVVGRVAGLNAVQSVRLVKGSHIVVRKFWEGEHAYLVQNDDKRVVFVNPYEDDLALIGTTDIAFSGAPETAAISAEEIDYLVRATNRYFDQTLSAEDVLHTFSGVRPLYDDRADDPSAVTRDYVFELDAGPGEAPLLSVFGGKITTFRKLAEQALARLEPYLPHMGDDWTSGVPLPGGDIAEADFDGFLNALGTEYRALPSALVRHCAQAYGTRARQVLAGAGGVGDLGHRFGPNLYEREVQYLTAHEWAQTPDDILERRTKHGLHMTPDEREAFSSWFCGLRVEVV